MGAVLSEDGKTAFVTNRREGSVSVVDLPGRAIVASIDHVGARPWGIDLVPSKLTSLLSGLAVIDAPSHTVLKRIPVGKGPWGIAVATSRAR